MILVLKSKNTLIGVSYKTIFILLLLAQNVAAQPREFIYRPRNALLIQAKVRINTIRQH